MVPAATFDGGPLEAALENGVVGKTQYAKPTTRFVHCGLSPAFIDKNWVLVMLKLLVMDAQPSPDLTV